MPKNNIKTVSIEDMLEAGVHFGHQTKRKAPQMDSFVYDTVQKNQIIDLTKTKAHLERAAEFLYEVAKTGKQVIFVGTKRQAAPIVEKYANEAGCLYVNQRWLGGTFTNFDSVAHNLNELERIESGLKTNAFAKYTKKERLLLSRKVEKLQANVGGLRGLKKYPGAVVAVDIKREKTAVAESNAMNIPVLGIVDTNSDPSKIQFVIPANDDAIKSIELLISVLASAVKEGYADKVEETPVEKVVEKPKAEIAKPANNVKPVSHAKPANYKPVYNKAKSQPTTAAKVAAKAEKPAKKSK